VTTLLSVPNVSEGRDPQLIDEIARAFDARLLSVHSDPDHHRSVFTLAGEPGSLANAVTTGAREATERIDLRKHHGLHPRVGAVDVAPIVYLSEDDRGAAAAEALVLADRLGSSCTGSSPAAVPALSCVVAARPGSPHGSRHASCAQISDRRRSTQMPVRCSWPPVHR